MIKVLGYYSNRDGKFYEYNDKDIEYAITRFGEYEGQPEIFYRRITPATVPRQLEIESYLLFSEALRTVELVKKKTSAKKKESFWKKLFK